MAGIGITESHNWFSAGWLYCALAEKLLLRIPAASRVHQQLQQSLDNETHFLVIADWTAAERSEFYQAVVDVSCEMKAQGASAFASPEFFPGFMDRLQELTDMLQKLPCRG